ncbi:hypothetical protein CHS0354_006492 [Potamilus streckersoni]|uniref:Uncharacterized protein n=1 Tax=Potamilus streckersoni TaxID=2493646 RepID=A0AAE0VG92_9BIVA|nr:hypothetical protein CHS0354_006492 [Potamilus streckersoni]
MSDSVKKWYTFCADRESAEMKLSVARIIKRLVGVGVIVCAIFIIMQLSTLANNQEFRPTLVLDSVIWKPEGKRIYAHALIDKETALSSYENYNPDDPRLIKFVKSFILPPSSEPYNLKRNNNIDFSRGQSSLIDTIFSKKERDWRGLLVEPNTKHYENLVSKHRKSDTLNACVKCRMQEFYKRMIFPLSNEMQRYIRGRNIVTVAKAVIAIVLI